MDFDLSQSQSELRSRARALAETRIVARETNNQIR